MRALPCILLTLLFLPACHKESPEAVDTVKAVPVTVETAREGPIRPVVAATGQVKPAIGAELLVIPPQEARIAEMPKAVGDRVRRGELLVRFEIPSLEADAAARRADLARAQAQLETARQSADRLAGLFDRGIAARKEVEDARRDLAQAEATVTEAQSAVTAAAELARRQVVRAPFDGVVVTRTRQVGDIVDPAAAEPLLRVIDPSRLQIEAAVPSGDLGRIGVGNPARVRGAGYPDEEARVIAGPPAVDPATGTGLVRLAFAAPTRRPAGLAVDVEIQGEERRALLVPAGAIVQEGPESFVFTVDARKKAHRRKVEVGVIAAGQAEILSGIKAGEPVVVRGQTTLPDGATVEMTERVSETSPACPSKPHPRPLSRGERGDLAERVELVGRAVRTVDVFEDTPTAAYGNPARRSPPSPPGRGAGGEASKGTWLDSAPTFQTPSDTAEGAP